MATQKPSRAKLLEEQTNFAAWREKKDEEASARRSQEAESRQREQEARRRKHVDGRQAYVTWKSIKEHQRQQRQREQRREEYAVQAVHGQLGVDKHQQAQAAFSSWKQQKDWERFVLDSRESPRPQPELNDILSGKEVAPRCPTPTYGSFCSVWSCDATLACRLQRHSPRSETYDRLPYILRQRATGDATSTAVAHGTRSRSRTQAAAADTRRSLLGERRAGGGLSRPPGAQTL